MSATWGRDWIKFYLHPSAQWELLPLSARGLGDELLRYADRATGSIALGKESLSALCRLLGAHPRERRRVKEDLEALKADGFCAVSDDGVLVIRNYLRAQSSVAPVTERVRATRAKQAGTPSVTPAEHEQTFPERSSDTSEHSANGESTATQRKDSPQNVTETPLLEETRKRLEEKREEIVPTSQEAGTTPAVEPPPAPKAQLSLTPAEPKAKTPRPDPLPFPVYAGLQAIAGKTQRFALPAQSELSKGRVIALGKQVRRFPKLEEWALVGEYLNANGEGWRGVISVSHVASDRFGEIVAAARSWEKSGRRKMDERGAPIDPTKGRAEGWSHARLGLEDIGVEVFGNG